MIKEINKILFENFEVINSKETFSSYETKFKCENIIDISNRLTQNNYELLKKFFLPFKCKWDLYIEDYSYSISQESYKPLEIEDDNSNMEILISFKIHKEKGEILIIEKKAFCDFIAEIDLESILSVFELNNLPIKFIGADYEIEIGNELEQKKLISLSKQCNFRNYAQYPFSPDYFYLEESHINVPKCLKLLLSKLTYIYTLIYIFDSSEIDKDKIILSISGFKTIKYNLNFKEINLNSFVHYHRIYNWIYSENNKIEDKIGLSRNVLTAYLSEKDIKITDSEFNSILSSNLIYVRGNITKYFEVRKKIIEQIEETIKTVNQSLLTFFSNFQKSIFIFISFFLTVFLSKAITKSQNHIIFTKETSIIGVGFIILSFLFLIFSVIMLMMDKERVTSRYRNVKERFKDVLTVVDIDNILNNDFEYNSEMSFFKKRTIIYICLWILTIFLFTIILFYASEYLALSKLKFLNSNE